MANKAQCAYCFDSLIDAIIESNDSVSSTSSSSSSSSNSSSTANASYSSLQLNHTSSSLPFSLSLSSSCQFSDTSKYPLFVTWKKKCAISGDWRLRGCIGTFTAKELRKGLSEYAVISGLRDSRFSPITMNEIPELRCDVSILIDFQYDLSADDWQVGVHGITIEFNDPSTLSRIYSATYLPEVPIEQGWNQQHTLEELVYKAGYRQKYNKQLKQLIRLTRFKSTKASLTFPEYQRMKQKQQQMIYHNNTSTNSNSVASNGIHTRSMMNNMGCNNMNGNGNLHHANGTSASNGIMNQRQHHDISDEDDMN